MAYNFYAPRTYIIIMLKRKMDRFYHFVQRLDEMARTAKEDMVPLPDYVMDFFEKFVVPEEDESRWTPENEAPKLNGIHIDVEQTFQFVAQAAKWLWSRERMLEPEKWPTFKKEGGMSTTVANRSQQKIHQVGEIPTPWIGEFANYLRDHGYMVDDENWGRDKKGKIQKEALSRNAGRKIASSVLSYWLQATEVDPWHNPPVVKDRRRPKTAWPTWGNIQYMDKNRDTDDRLGHQRSPGAWQHKQSGNWYATLPGLVDGRKWHALFDPQTGQRLNRPEDKKKAMIEFEKLLHRFYDEQEMDKEERAKEAGDKDYSQGVQAFHTKEKAAEGTIKKVIENHQFILTPEDQKFFDYFRGKIPPFLDRPPHLLPLLTDKGPVNLKEVPFKQLKYVSRPAIDFLNNATARRFSHSLIEDRQAKQSKYGGAPGQYMDMVFQRHGKLWLAQAVPVNAQELAERLHHMDDKLGTKLLERDHLPYGTVIALLQRSGIHSYRHVSNKGGKASVDLQYHQKDPIASVNHMGFNTAAEYKVAQDAHRKNPEAMPSVTTVGRYDDNPENYDMVPWDEILRIDSRIAARKAIAHLEGMGLTQKEINNLRGSEAAAGSRGLGDLGNLAMTFLQSDKAMNNKDYHRQDWRVTQGAMYAANQAKRELGRDVIGGAGAASHGGPGDEGHDQLDQAAARDKEGGDVSRDAFPVDVQNRADTENRIKQALDGGKLFDRPVEVIPGQWDALVAAFTKFWDETPKDRMFYSKLKDLLSHYIRYKPRPKPGQLQKIAPATGAKPQV